MAEEIRACDILKHIYENGLKGELPNQELEIITEFISEEKKINPNSLEKN